MSVDSRMADAFEALMNAANPQSLQADTDNFCTPYLYPDTRLSSTKTDIITLIFVVLFSLSVLGLIFIATTILYS